MPDLSSWPYRVRVVVDHTKVAGPLRDFPMLVTGDGFPDHYWANILADGADIRFTDIGGEVLSHEVVNVDAVGRAQELWVRVPGLSDRADTVLYVRYGNAEATMPTAEEQAATWEGYGGSWSMRDATATTIADATANANNGTKQSAGHPAQGTGNIGYGQVWDATSLIDVGTKSTLRPTATLTLSAWVYPTTLVGNHRIINCFYITGGYYGWALVQSGSVLLAQVTTTAGLVQLSTVPGILTQDAWQHVAMTYDGSNIRIYRNGVLVRAAPHSGVLTYNAASTTYIGGGFSQPWAGTLDEVRVSSIARPAAWNATEYANQSSPGTFYSVSDGQSTSSDTYMVHDSTATELRTHVSGVLVEGLYVPNTLVGWSHRIPVIVDHTKVSGPLRDFPVLLTGANFPAHYWSNIQPDGADIRITDMSGEVLSHEVVSVDASGQTQQLWVKVPGLSNLTDTTLQVWYGNPAATMPTEAEQAATWTNRNGAVWHLGETDGNLLDSTGNGNTLVRNGTTAVSGAFGTGQHFDGTAWLEAPSSPSVSPTVAYTYSFWINSSHPVTGGQSPLWRGPYGDVGWPVYGVWFINYGTANDYFIARMNVGGYQGVGHYLNETGSVLHHIAVRWATGDPMSVWIDGTLFMQSGAITGLLPSSSTPVYVGKKQDGYGVVGMMDEVRIVPVFLSRSELQTEYNNQSSPSTFYSVGSVQDASSPLVYQMHSTARAETGLYGPGDMIVRGYPE